MRDPLIGSVLHERYRLLRRIGRGGMGIVYLAEHVLIGRSYAVKVLSERANATDEMVARFHREAVAAASVGSEHVVEVTDMGQLDDGSYFIVMEYLEGLELAKAVAADGAFDPGRAVRIVCQLCEALSAVHEKGIVHRDLKPENLFLVQQRAEGDFLKVLDFGVCKLLEGPAQRDSDLPALTRTNASLGTPQYMAPEQFHASARVDHRADIHAAAAVLYFMLTGKPPFDAPSLAQLAMRACVEPPPTLLAQRPELPAALDAVIQRAMAKHPDDRYPTSAALREALLPFVELRALPGSAPRTLPGPASSTYPTQPAVTPFEAAPRPALPGASSGSALILPQRRWPIALSAGSLVAVVLAAMIWGTGGLSHSNAARRPPPPPPKAMVGASAPARGELTFFEDLHSEPQTHAEPARPQPTLRPNSKKPLSSIRSGAAPSVPSELAPVTQASEASSLQEPTEPAAVPPVRSGDATYHFPRRTLKDVF